MYCKWLSRKQPWHHFSLVYKYCHQKQELVKWTGNISITCLKVTKVYFTVEITSAGWIRWSFQHWEKAYYCGWIPQTAYNSAAQQVELHHPAWQRMQVWKSAWGSNPSARTSPLSDVRSMFRYQKTYSRGRSTLLLWLFLPTAGLPTMSHELPFENYVRPLPSRGQGMQSTLLVPWGKMLYPTTVRTLCEEGLGCLSGTLKPS